MVCVCESRPLQDLPRSHFIHQPITHFMSQPIIAQKSPMPVVVEAGKTYFWCSCGQSKGQPFCDGSHKGSEFAPTRYTAEKDGTVYFCACKHSGNGPLCDGSHAKL